MRRTTAQQGARRAAGFSMVELMITLAIIASLATIALPLFENFQCRTRIAEARSVIKSLRSASFSYYALHEAFPYCFEQLALDLPSTGANAYGQYYQFTLHFGATPEWFVYTAVGYQAVHGIFATVYAGPGYFGNTPWRVDLPGCEF